MSASAVAVPLRDDSGSERSSPGRGRIPTPVLRGQGSSVSAQHLLPSAPESLDSAEPDPSPAPAAAAKTQLPFSIASIMGSNQDKDCESNAVKKSSVNSSREVSPNQRSSPHETAKRTIGSPASKLGHSGLSARLTQEEKVSSPDRLMISRSLRQTDEPRHMDSSPHKAPHEGFDLCSPVRPREVQTRDKYRQSPSGPQQPTRPVMPVPTHAAAQYYHMLAAAEAHRRSLCSGPVGLAGNASGTGALANKDFMLEMTTMARYLPYFHPAFLMGRMNEYRAQQLLRHYPGHLQQQQHELAAREFPLRGDQFHPGKISHHSAVDPEKSAEDFSQALLGHTQNTRLQASNPGDAFRSKLDSNPLRDKSPDTGQSAANSSQQLQSKFQLDQKDSDIEEVDDSMIDVTDLENVKSAGEKTLDLSLKSSQNLSSADKNHLISPVRNQEQYNRYLAQKTKTPDSRKSGIENLTMCHPAKFSSPDSCGSTTSGIVSMSDRESGHSPGDGSGSSRRLSPAGVSSPCDDAASSSGLPSPGSEGRDALQNLPPGVTAPGPGKPSKTFTCLECGKVFNAHYNLTRHMPVHTGARPFICKICGKGTIRISSFLHPSVR